MLITTAEQLVELADSFVDMPEMRDRFFDTIKYWGDDESLSDGDLESLALSEAAMYGAIRGVLKPQYALECPRCAACMMLALFEMIDVSERGRWEMAN